MAIGFLAGAVLGCFYLAAVVVIRHTERQADQERKYHKDKVELNFAHISTQAVRDHSSNTKHNTQRTQQANDARNLLLSVVVHMAILASAQYS